MLQGLLEHWPEGEIFVYYEDKKPDLDDPRITYKNLFDIEGCTWFLEGIDRFNALKGRIGQNTYSYRHDIFKFCRKSFAQIDAARDYKGTLIWLDSDIETFRNIPEHWFYEWLGDTAVAYLGRKEWHLCASFLIWDCSMVETKRFFEIYQDIYLNGNVLTLPEIHDSFIVEVLINQLKMPATDITGNVDKKGPYNVFDTVFEGRARHLKGKLKSAPRRYNQLIDIVSEMKPERIIEIGTWNGDRAIQMHEASPDSFYYGFDLFEFANDETDQKELNVKKHYHGQEVALKLHNHDIQYQLYAGDTKDTLPEFLEKNGEKFAQLIFIDGGHSIETIKSDFEYCSRLIAPGGIIVLDDYYEGRDDTDRFGCNFLVDQLPFAHVLPISDPVSDQGYVKMVLIRHGDLDEFNNRRLY